MKQTAVEWLVEKLREQKFVTESQIYIAEEMEKKQMIEMHDKGFDSVEQLNEEFAIEFAEWVSYKYKYLENKGWFSTSYQLEMGIFLSSKKLLEIFKQEKL